MDLDLLLYGDAVLIPQGMDVPRAEITRYPFILWPLAEIAAHVSHPLKHKTFAELWRLFQQQNPDKMHSIHPVAFHWDEK